MSNEEHSTRKSVPVVAQENRRIALQAALDHSKFTMDDADKVVKNAEEFRKFLEGVDA